MADKEPEDRRAADRAAEEKIQERVRKAVEKHNADVRKEAEAALKALAESEK